MKREAAFPSRPSTFKRKVCFDFFRERKFRAFSRLQQHLRGMEGERKKMSKLLIASAKNKMEEEKSSSIMELFCHKHPSRPKSDCARMSRNANYALKTPRAQRVGNVFLRQSVAQLCLLFPFALLTSRMDNLKSELVPLSAVGVRSGLDETSDLWSDGRRVSWAARGEIRPGLKSSFQKRTEGTMVVCSVGYFAVLLERRAVGLERLLDVAA